MTTREPTFIESGRMVNRQVHDCGCVTAFDVLAWASRITSPCNTHRAANEAERAMKDAIAARDECRRLREVIAAARATILDAANNDATDHEWARQARAALHILTLPEAWPAPRLTAEMRALLWQAREALRHTREYIGEEKLPAVEGWTWYDATVAIDAALSGGFPGADDQAAWERVRVPAAVAGIRALRESARDEAEFTNDQLLEATSIGQIQVCDFVLRMLTDDEPPDEPTEAAKALARMRVAIDAADEDD